MTACFEELRSLISILSLAASELIFSEVSAVNVGLVYFIINVAREGFRPPEPLCSGNALVTSVAPLGSIEPRIGVAVAGVGLCGLGVALDPIQQLTRVDGFGFSNYAHCLPQLCLVVDSAIWLQDF